MSQKSKGFIDSKNLTKWVRYFLYINILVSIISLVSGNMEYQLLSDYENGAYTSQEQAVADGEANDSRQVAIGIAYLIVFIISGFMILKWIYRANYNARQLGAMDMQFTSGWSIGWYFVPIFMLWKPYQAMKEIWKASSNPNDWNTEKISSVLPWWWFFWLFNNFLGQAVFRMSLRVEEISELKNLNILYQVSDVIAIILAIVTISFVNAIYKMQAIQATTNS